MDGLFRDELERRREAVRKKLRTAGGGDGSGDVLVLFSSPVFFRNSDVEHSFRQHSDFYYLTGFEEPESALILTADDPGFVLFVRPSNREREIWEGRRVGVDRAPEVLGADVAHSIEELDEKLADYFEDRDRVHYLLGESDAWDRTIVSAIKKVRSRRRKRVHAPTQLVDAGVILHEMRLFKSPWEQEAMAEVCELSALGHIAAMRAAGPSVSEWEVQNQLETVFRENGSRRVAYDSIVGSGDNATILHYRENNRVMQDGELVLIDAGAEKNYLAADITRTFPVSGKFTEVQARIYRYVLAAQEAAIAATVIGASLDDVHDAACAVLREALSAEGLVAADADDETKEESLKRYYMHRTSHFLGMDVHDVGRGIEQSARLEAGMVITVEPGLYFAPDDPNLPSELRGLGIRIEDDVLVTSGAPRVLTERAPKTIEDIERACEGTLAVSARSA